jgi:hypothetical protein
MLPKAAIAGKSLGMNFSTTCRTAPSLRARLRWVTIDRDF